MAISVLVDLSQVENLMGDNPAQIIKENWDNASRETRPMMVGFIGENTPVRTGNLIMSVSSDVTRAENAGSELVWYSDVLYADFVDKGTSKMEGHYMFELAFTNHFDEITEPYQRAGTGIASQLVGK